MVPTLCIAADVHSSSWTFCNFAYILSWTTAANALVTPAWVCRLAPVRYSALSLRVLAARNSTAGRRKSGGNTAGTSTADRFNVDAARSCVKTASMNISRTAVKEAGSTFACDRELTARFSPTALCLPIRKTSFVTSTPNARDGSPDDRRRGNETRNEAEPLEHPHRSCGGYKNEPFVGVSWRLTVFPTRWAEHERFLDDLWVTNPRRSDVVLRNGGIPSRHDRKVEQGHSLALICQWPDAMPPFKAFAPRTTKEEKDGQQVEGAPFAHQDTLVLIVH